MQAISEPKELIRIKYEPDLDSRSSTDFLIDVRQYVEQRHRRRKRIASLADLTHFLNQPLDKLRTSLTNRVLVANTAVYWMKDGILVQDNPNIIEGKIALPEEEFRGEVINGVSFSSDRRTRFIPRDFYLGSYNRVDIENSPALTVLFGAESLNNASEAIRRTGLCIDLRIGKREVHEGEIGVPIIQLSHKLSYFAGTYLRNLNDEKLAVDLFPFNISRDKTLFYTSS